jgi:hypothetical protein
VTSFGRETIGAAYIRVLADMSGFDDSAKKGFEESRALHEDEGKKAAEAYAKGRDDELQKKPLSQSVEEGLAKEKSRLEGIEAAIGKDFTDKIVQAVGDEDIGKKLSQKIQEGLYSNRIKPEDVDKFIPQALFDATKSWMAELDKLNSRLHGPDLPNWAKGATSAERALFALKKTTGDAAAGVEDTGKKAESAFSKIATFSESAKTKIDKFGDSVGKVFGAGSRNNFFNIIGSAMGTLVKLPGVLFGAVDGLAKLATKFQDAVQAAGGFSSFLTGILPKLAQFGAIGVGGIAGIAVLVLGLIQILGPAIALVWGLVGALVALTGAVAAGLIGAMAALLPLVVGVGAAFGVLFLAISGQSQASKTAQTNLNNINKQVQTYRDQVAKAKPGTDAYKVAVQNLNGALERQHQAQSAVNADLATLAKPLTDFVTKARDVAQQHLFANASKDAKDFQVAFQPLLGLIARIADAIGAVVTKFAQASKSPEFKGFIDALSSALPKIIISLGDAMVKFGGGFAALFRDLLPYGQRLADAIDRLAGGFDRWATSAKGQTGIHNFLATAWDDATKLWDIIVNLGKVIGDVFFNPSATKTGGGFLDSINSSLERLDRWLNTPKGRDQLTKWFDDAKNIVQEFGPVLNNLVTMFANFDTKHAQDNLKTFMNLLNQLGNIAAFLTGFLNAQTGLWNLTFKTVAFTWNAVVATIFTGVKLVVNTFLDMAYWIVTAAANAFGWVPGLGGKLRGAQQAVAGFRDDVNAKLNQIQKNISITVGANTKPGVDAVNTFVDFANRQHATITVSAVGHPSTGGILGSPTAAGRIVYGPTNLLAGEAGAEAIVPLTRPLSQVDPAVRGLAAVAQGKPLDNNPATQFGATYIAKAVDVGGITVVTPLADPIAVAQQVVNRISASGYS